MPPNHDPPPAGNDQKADCLRHEQREPLVESERHFRALGDNALVGIYIVQDGILTYVNAALAKMVGRLPSGLIGNSPLVFIHPEDHELVAENMRRRMAGELKAVQYVFRVIHENGDIKYIEVFGSRIELNNRPAIIGYGVDITERQLAEDALKQSEATLHSIFEAAPVGIIIVVNRVMVRMNNRFCEITGYALEELVGRPADMVYRDRAEFERVGKLLYTDIAARKKTSAEAHGRRKDGTPIIVQIDAALLDDANPAAGVVCTALDITENKRAENELISHRDHLEDLVLARTAELQQVNARLKELDQLKSMFIASMSHELRTPLNSIIGFTGLTLHGLSGPINDEQRDNLSRAYQSAKHLLSLITDVIDISKIEAGRVESFRVAVSLRKLIAEAIASVAPQLKEKKLDLEVRLAADIELHTDRKRLLQCLINLLGNSVKFTEQGGITVSVQEEHAAVSIAVTDTGIGIAEADMPKLFEAFERLETHLRIRAGGTGLGLYLTKKLVTEILRGSISVESSVGRGSTFCLHVPRDINAPVHSNFIQGDMVQ